MKHAPKQRPDALRRAVVKVGSNVLTAEAGLTIDAVASISTQICQLLDSGLEIILVSSGAMGRSASRPLFSAHARGWIDPCE
jgi:glutamate 5-kinase